MLKSGVSTSTAITDVKVVKKLEADVEISVLFRVLLTETSDRHQ
jgi:hypothetical protein